MATTIVEDIHQEDDEFVVEDDVRGEDEGGNEVDEEVNVAYPAKRVEMYDTFYFNLMETGFVWAPLAYSDQIQFLAWGKVIEEEVTPKKEEKIAIPVRKRKSTTGGRRASRKGKKKIAVVVDNT